MGSKRRKYRPSAQINKEIEAIKNQNSRKKMIQDFEKVNISPLIEIISSIRSNEYNYERMFFSLFKTGKLNIDAKRRIKLLEEEIDSMRRIFEKEHPELTTRRSGLVVDVPQEWKLPYLERELEDSIKEEESIRRANNNRDVKAAQVAEVLGKSRQLAATVKSKLPRHHPCPYCGGSLGENPHADHIYPVSKGGQSRPQNMVYVCYRCNMKKGDHTLANFIYRYKLDRDIIERRLRQLGKEF